MYITHVCAPEACLAGFSVAWVLLLIETSNVNHVYACDAYHMGRRQC